ncbi:hypothetical protein DFJ63DRAFT_337993 [Scheffersomyces coipomensis]|uniref:uncharacterized protein n=1 Tax=Scheffersomyces coipomensis TaxID=1788519 RepID=UPI00315D5090
MALFAKIKCFVASFLLFYTIYLYNYKCVELKETSFEHAAESVLHPLSHHHSQACEVLDTAAGYVHPYIVQTQAFLDEHVHSHPLFIEYGIHEKLVSVQDAFVTYVYPYIHQLFQYFAVVETAVYDQFSEHLATLQGLYEEHFGSK